MATEGGVKQIYSHTGLRGLAALLVVAYHLQYRAGHLPVEDMTSFFRRSYLMVDLFFVLSGFIIAYVYDINQSVVMSLRDAKTFLLRRVIRIYPLHLLALLVLLLFNGMLSLVFIIADRPVPTDWSTRSIEMLGAQFLLVNVWLAAPNGWNIPSWSISAEFVAYLTFPLMVFCAAKQPKLTFALMAALLTAFYFWVPVGGSLDITGGSAAVARCLAGFAAGFLLHAHRALFARPSTAVLTVTQAIAVVWILAVMTAPVADSWAMPGFILLVATTWTDRGAIARGLSTRPLQKLGDISFAVYITHVVLLSMFNWVWERSGRRYVTDLATERTLYIICCFTLVLVAASLIHRYVEQPLRSYFGRLLARSRKTEARPVRA